VLGSDAILRAIFVSFVPLWLNFLPRPGQMVTLGSARQSHCDQSEQLPKDFYFCASVKIQAMAGWVEAAENIKVFWFGWARFRLFFRKECPPSPAVRIPPSAP
jgi:hypothetical protein